MNRALRTEKVARFCFKLSIGESVKIRENNEKKSTWLKFLLLAQQNKDGTIEFLQNEFSIMNRMLEVDC